MRRPQLIAKFVLIAVMLSAAISSGQGQSSLPTIGSSAADFKLFSPTLNAAVQLLALKGQPVVLNFWGSWCAPCRDEMPALNEIAGQLKTKFILLAIGVNEPAAKSLKYLQDNNFGNLTLLSDPAIGAGADLETSAQVTKKYGVDAYPTTIFIDKAGLIQAVRLSGLTKSSFLSYLRNIDVTR